jgi:tyrosyl-tRNA synthetase
LFGRGDLAALDAVTLRDATAELPGAAVAAGATITEALVATGLVESRNAARRAVGDGAVSLNGAKVSDAELPLASDDFLHGVAAVIRRGKKNLAAVRPT